ncbi:hypothetical protein AVEN_274785-1 [Araneus ventricosus]|uniref:Uncharacterized protein n=1 Tax=Araneus ventricosus TaxID=182803 RepID=A0A4Y2B4J5_ARAVE|nr:hypothetical protein AVEN_237550-1 [Araneus ventricosus]GBL87252.1 hypothetical protein AVEN_274785-1 [Araneus ventricosus]
MRDSFIIPTCEHKEKIYFRRRRIQTRVEKGLFESLPTPPSVTSQRPFRQMTRGEGGLTPLRGTTRRFQLPLPYRFLTHGKGILGREDEQIRIVCMASVTERFRASLISKNTGNRRDNTLAKQSHS